MRDLVCQMCHDKNNTNSLHQLRMIVRNLEHIIGKKDVDAQQVESLMHRFGGRYPMFETNLRCHYGYHCSNIERTNGEMRREAERVPNLIIQASLVNTDAVYPLLRMMGGYFPRAYRFTEEVIGYVKKNINEI